MNIAELRDSFNALVDDDVDNAMLIVWFNEAQEDIAIRYGPVTSVDLTVEAGVPVELPNNFLREALVVTETGTEYRDYQIDELGRITFTDSGTFKFHYHRTPTRLAVGNDSLVPDIHETLHSPMYLYAASMFYDRESGGDEEESAMASKFMLRYETMVNRRVKALKARKRKVEEFSR